MTPLVEGVVPIPELLDAPITWVCDERDVSVYAKHVALTDSAQQTIDRMLSRAEFPVPGSFHAFIAMGVFDEELKP